MTTYSRKYLGPIDENKAITTKIYVDEAYTLPPATPSTLGGIKIGDNLVIDEDGVLRAEVLSYTLPAATTTTIGGVIIGDNLVIVDGVLSAEGIVNYTLPVATESTLGGIKIGSNLTITDGVLSANASSYTLPIASDSVLGGIKVGDGLTINETGVLSSNALNYVVSEFENVGDSIIPAGSPVKLVGSGVTKINNSNIAFGIMMENCDIGFAKKVMLTGYLSIAGWGLTTGSAYYTGDVGGITTTITTTVGRYSQRIGIATNESTLAVLIDPPIKI